MTVVISPGFYPFWFWNGNMSAEEIRRQIDEMAKQGIRGFFIHPRQGMSLPYLSGRFLEMVGVAVACAAEHGMAANIYDEYPYPSGVAGGEVVLGNPAAYATRLVQSAHDVAGGRISLPLARGKVLECRAFPLSGVLPDWSKPMDLRKDVGMVLDEESYVLMGLTAYNRKRYFASAPRPMLDAVLPEARYRIYVSVQTVPDRQKYWGYFPDVMNPEVIRSFIDLTHERYRAGFGQEFGKTIQAVFTDETAPSWTEAIPKEFLKRYGYDILPELHVLQDSRHPRHIRISADLDRLKYELFCESFEKQVSGWCGRNGLAYTGEKPSMRLSQLKFMDIPGCEPGHTKAGAKTDVFGESIRSNARATASATYFYGKSHTLCECYHSMGWAATLQDAKLVAELLLLAGVDTFVPHGFFYSTHALRKHDAPPSFFFQMPSWQFFGHLSRRLEKMLAQLRGTHIAPEILIVEPSSGLPGKAELGAYSMLQRVLASEHYEFMMVDTDILESARIDSGRIRIRDIDAGLVILPPMRFVEKPLEEWLAAFERKGGRVMKVPVEFEQKWLISEVGKAAKPALRLTAVDAAATDVLVTRREGQGRTLWLLMNTGRRTADLSIDAGCELREVSLSDRPGLVLKKDGQGYSRALRPFESVLIEEGPNSGEGTELPVARISACGPARVSVPDRNLLRMYDWRMSLLDEVGVAVQTAEVPAIPIGEQLAAGGFRFAPRLERYFGHSPELRLPDISVQYEYAFLNEYPGPVELVMEPGSIVGKWSLQINDSESIGPEAFGNSCAHVRGSLGAEITGLLRRGSNTVRVNVKTDRLDGGLLNALYLAGDFAVGLDPLTLKDRESAGIFEEYEANGLPFYSGIVEYSVERDLADIPAGDEAVLEVDCGEFFEEACEISINGRPWQPVLWEPRCVRIKTSELKKGRNDLRIRVYGTLSRSFEGQRFDARRHEYVNVDAPRGR